jgi:hypothetical protein
MTTNNNIDLYVEEISTLNPKIENFAQIYENNWPSVLDSMLQKENYLFELSLLYQGTTAKIIEYCDDFPANIIQYRIIFMIGTNCIDEESNPTGLAPPTRFFGTANFGSCVFHGEYFGEHYPCTISTTDCHGNRCRKDYTVREKGIWCTGCHGDFNYAQNLQLIMVKSINFNHMPLESLVFIEKIVTPIDHANLPMLKEVHDILVKEKNIMVSLQDSIDGTEQEIKKIVDELTKKKQVNELKLQTFLSSRTRSIVKFSEIVTQYQEKILAIEKKESDIQKKLVLEKLMREKETLQQQISELQQKMDLIH